MKPNLKHVHIRNNGDERVVSLTAGDILRVDQGDVHYAEPIGEARMTPSR